MGGPTKSVCFACLKTINHQHNDHGGSELFEKFARVLTGYLQVSSFDLGVRSADDNVRIFCGECATLVTQVWDVYQELRAVELRLSTSFGQLGEVMMKKPKLTQGLSISLAEQLQLKPIIGVGRSSAQGQDYVEKVRNVIAFKCALKGREMELDQVLDKDNVDKKESVELEQGYQNGTVVKKIKIEVVESTEDDFRTEGEDSRGPYYNDLDSNFSDDDQKVTGAGDEEEIGGDKYLELSDASSESESESNSDWSESSFEKKPKKKTTKRKLTLNSNQEFALGINVKRKKKLESKSGPDPEALQLECEQCGMTGLPNKALFVRHLNIHEDKEQLKNIPCNFCWMSFALPQTYELHLKMRHEKSHLVFICDHNQCGESAQSFATTQELNEHLKTHTESIHTCSHCNWGFLNQNMMELHELTHLRSVRGNYPCQKCSSILHGFQKLTDHYNVRHGAQLELYKCPKCSASCVTKVNLDTHIKGHETGKESSSAGLINSCGVCERKFRPGKKGKALLIRHMKSQHTVAVEYACCLCNITCPSDRALDRHMKKEHQTTKRICSICKKEYASRTALWSHMKTMHPDPNNPEDKKLCPHCGSTFRSQKYLWQHIWIVHTELYEGEGKHMCSDCGERFHRLDLLRRHSKKCVKNEPVTASGTEVEAMT
ncbi:unnamed protein product [Orchesella dallaii]|uniref:C2H2-type domain-containing protein n=1 Tax=Orchesella dallaii TaxID=48710 RepID=A0ABP1RIY8_9HEXA